MVFLVFGGWVWLKGWFWWVDLVVFVVAFMIVKGWDCFWFGFGNCWSFLRY